MSNRHPLSVNVINGRGVARTAGRGVSGLLAGGLLVVGLNVALALAVYALIAVTAYAVIVTVVRRTRPARPVAPVATPARVDDEAARAHRARMAAILARRP